MHTSFSDGLAKYISWILKQYREIKSSYDQEPDLKIAAFEASSNANIVVVKVKNRGLFAKFDVYQLAQDNVALERFSPDEQEKIKLCAKTGQPPKHPNTNEYEKAVRIRSKSLDKQEKKHVFTLESNQSGVRFVKRLYTEELVKNKKILELFDKEDVYEIAYSKGIESILIEYDEIEKAKKEFIEQQKKHDK